MAELAKSLEWEHFCELSWALIHYPSLIISQWLNSQGTVDSEIGSADYCWKGVRRGRAKVMPEEAYLPSYMPRLKSIKTHISIQSA